MTRPDAVPLPTLQLTMLEQLRAAMGDDSGAFASQLVRIYLDQAVDLLGRLGKAAEAADYAGLREDAHALRGSTEGVGGTNLASLCYDLELVREETSAVEELVASVNRVCQEFSTLAEQLSSYLSQLDR